MNPLQAPQQGPLWKDLPISRAFFDMSLEFLNKSSSGRNSHPSLKGPRKGASHPHAPQNGDLVETDPHFQSRPLPILQSHQ